MFTRFQVLVTGFLAAMVVFAAVFGYHSTALGQEAEASKLSMDAIGQTLDDGRQLVTDTDAAYVSAGESADKSGEKLTDISATLSELIAHAEAEKALSDQQKQAVDQMVADSGQHVKETGDVLDTVLSKILGDPIGQTFGKKSTIKVYSLTESGYRGYMAKVKLHDPNAVKLALSHDKVGDKGETTSQAASRNGAILAVNGGGFARSKGLIYPMGITVVDGEIKTFNVIDDFSFIGFNNKGNLVGGAITKREQIEELNIKHGASFVPTLLQGGKKQKIPSKWANRREPRTLIGHFSNGDLLFIVIDGRQKDYSNGVTLEEAQDKLLEFNVRDAYTLDGGGSSTFYYDGKVLNRPSDGKERLLASSFVVFS